MNTFAFLGNLNVAPNAAPKKAAPKKKERNPVLAALRVFKNGSVYPSAALVQQFGLEYTEDGGGNGFDVIDSRKLQNTAGNPQAFLMIAPVSREKAKIDLFSKAGKTAEGEIVSVMDQGAKTFGVRLLEMVKEVYGIEPTETQDFIDLTIVKSEELQTLLQTATNGIYFVPKVVAAGPRKGEPDYERRENLDIYVLAPVTPATTAADIAQPETQDASDDEQEAGMFVPAATAEENLVGGND